MAGARDVTSFGVKMLTDETSFVTKLQCPVLLWTAAPMLPEPIFCSSVYWPSWRARLAVSCKP